MPINWLDFASLAVALSVIYQEKNILNIDPATFAEFKKWAEIIYFISGTGIFILACFGLRQITLAKNQIETSKDIFKTQSKRASFESAAQQCTEYSKNIIQLDHKISKFTKSNEITFFTDAKIEESGKGFRVNIQDVKKEDIQKFDEIADIVSSFINGIEGFSLYIISEIADEDIAFHSVGKAFIRHAEMAAKIMRFTNSSPEDTKAIWKLYFRWKKRIESQKLESEKKIIEDKIKKNKTEPFRAIGT